MQRWVDFDQVTADALENVLHEMDLAAEPAAMARTAGAFRDLPATRRSRARSKPCATAGCKPGS